MKKKKLRWGMIFVYLFIGIFGIITVFPFIYMILGGLMSYQETTTIPKTLRWSNYQKVFEQAPFARYFLNTFITAAITTIVTLFTSILGAFAMTNLKFKGKGFIQLIFLSLLMVPGEAIIFTNYNTIAHLGLLNTYLGFTVLNIYLLYVLFTKLLHSNFTNNL